MKKIIIQSGLIVVVLLAIFIVIKSALGAENNEYITSGNQKAEEIDGMLHKIETVYGPALITDINDMLKKLQIEVYSEDRISSFPSPEWGLGSKIVIKRANALYINDGGEEKIIRTWKNTVRDAFEENNIVVGEQDVISASLNSQLTDLTAPDKQELEDRNYKGSSPVLGIITITRVAETEIKETKEIEYKTITKKDPDLEKGKTKVEESGKNGLKELTYKIRRENGKEISRDLIKTEIIREPQNKIILEGTKVIVLGTGKATWYNLVSGMTAASNTLPYGTMVHVVNTENGKSVDVKIVDHGIQGGAIIDLSKEAFEKIGSLDKGVIQVRLEKP